MPVLMEVSVETVSPTYRKASNPVRLKSLRQGSQACRGGQRTAVCLR